MLDLLTVLEFPTSIMLVLALIFVLIYEATNGFHDTANAVGTVIYTRAMRSQLAVAMSGIFNFLGVLMGGLSVAYAIVHLLPTDLLLNISSAHGLAMMFSMLLAALLWNLGTWHFGLPASSSHTLIGAIIGIGLTNALVSDSSVVQALNIPKLIEILLSLIISPAVGLLLAGTMVFVLRQCWSSTPKRRRIHLTPAEREREDGKHKPPLCTRIALIFSAAGVSFSHGANDGQKGIGLIMLVLIGVAPTGFVVNINASSYDISRTRDAVNYLQQYYTQHLNKFTHIDSPNDVLVPSRNVKNPGSGVLMTNKQILKQVKRPQMQVFHCDLSRALFIVNNTSLLLKNLDTYESLNAEQRSYVRRLLICAADIADKIAKLPDTSAADKRFLSSLRKDLLYTVEYAPMWIIVIVAIALSLGTMVGWRRVATTIGEKIGKKGMTYAQGLSAQLTAAVSIGVASYTGMPVSTTHVLSSAVTGTMVMDGRGVQSKTVKNILLAWMLTLPIAIILASNLYWLALKLI
ncbi:inorganic phosphate transporter PitA [Sodalis endosymbiont of Henestaris halophilus]|uniref:inorganic phosphate transporter PitA n=1 Tax=Sodalis endosymbiont of Henestaris halophilus TaxID=1929246 RepID=UPI000BBFD1C6|nr:inorganic phosphate transporter PitA [Sodalis endosymbiont of Henestaris halophilus]SNC58823.1 Low-affinity inorganic phosphate transporter 1 [Sodalis endosymbiont of Henestaris halophilus]